MSLFRTPLTLSLLALIPALAPSAELTVRDVRGAVLIRGGDFDFDIDSDTFDTSGSDSFDSGTGLEIGARYSFSSPGSSWGLVVGGDITADWYTYDSDGELSMYGARAAVGAGWAPLDRWTFVMEGGGGLAMSEFSLPADSTTGDFTADGTALFYDLRVSCLYRAARRWSVHGHVGYMMAEHDLSGDGVDVTLDQTGLWVGIGMTWMFSGKPPTLE